MTLTHEGRSGEASPAPPKDGAVATAAEKEAGPRLGRRLRGLLPTRSGSRSDSCVLTHLLPACAPRPGLLPSQGVWTTGPVSECCAFTRKSCGPCSPRRPLANESEVAQSCSTLRDPMDCSPPGSSVHGIFQVHRPCLLPNVWMGTYEATHHLADLPTDHKCMNKPSLPP